MMEEGITAVSLPSSPYLKSPSPFSSFRFLGCSDHPNPSNTCEFDEGDVVWSPEIYSDLSSAVIESPTSTIPSSPTSDGSPVSPSDPVRHRPFLPDKLGLAVALAEDRRAQMHSHRTAINVPMGRSEACKIFHQSAPVNVPVWPRGRRMPSSALIEVEDCWEDEAVNEMIPPHVIVARSHVTTFSVFEGVGRTLKGRDLRRVRNAVFQRTGFLD